MFEVLLAKAEELITRINAAPVKTIIIGSQK